MTTDTSTTGTRVDAWETAERTATERATRLDDQARDQDREAGLIADLPDMAPAHEALRQSADQTRETAERRRGFARAYGALKQLVS